MDRKECLEGNPLISEMKARGFLSNYFSLKQVLLGAVEQAESGKGKERHAEEGEPFERQIICEVARRVGLGYPLGQAVKKIYESQRLGGTKGLDELLGAINYVAAAYIVMQEHVKAATAKEQEEFNAQLDKAEDERRKHMFPKDHPLSFERQARVFAENNPPEEPDGNNPENPDSSPEFKPGDRVQFRDEIPSTSEPHWFDGTYVERLSTGGHAVKFGPHGHVIHCSDKEIRRAPKAEGCEELAMADAEEVEKAFGKPDGGCCQNGKDHANPRVVEWVNKWNEERKREEANPLSFERQARVFAENNPPEEPEGNNPENPDSSPEFKPGDKVQAKLGQNGEWVEAIYEHKFSDNVHLVRRIEGVFLREPLFYSPGSNTYVVDAVRPAPKAEGCEELEFKSGDAVEWNSVGQNWHPAVYLREFGDFGHCVVQIAGSERIVCKVDIRRPEANYPDGSKRAEGCEELVRNEAEECRDCDGFKNGPVPEGCEGCMKTLDADAPQTPHDLYKRIIDANPATFKTRTPTGEELAEMAEEDAHG